MATAGRMQYTYRTKEEAEKSRRHWATKAGNTTVRRNKRKHGYTYTLIIQF